MEQAQALYFPMKASVVRRRFRCEKPGCRYAKGTRHRNMIVIRIVGGKTQKIRTSSGREATALEWVENWRKLDFIYMFQEKLVEANACMNVLSKSQSRQSYDKSYTGKP